MVLSVDVQPRFFDALTGSVPLLIVLVVGGVTSIGGAILASFLFSLAPILRPQAIDSGLQAVNLKQALKSINLADLTFAIFGILLRRGRVTNPSGLVGQLDKSLRRLAAWRRRGGVAVPAEPAPVEG